MKSKKTIIISSLIMCLTLIVAVVSVTAAWFGNVTSQSVTDLEINSGTVSASADVDITSGETTGLYLLPAIATAGYFGNTKTYPGNYFTSEADESFDFERAQYLDPTLDSQPGIETKAKSVQFILSIRYIGPVDENNGNRKKVQLILDGAYLEKDLTKTQNGDTTKYQGYDEADAKGRNFKNEFNVKMTLVKENSLESPVVEDLTHNLYDNTYSKDNPYGHILTVQAASTITYYVKFEIYFNKVDEECNPELLFTNLVLHIKLDMGKTEAPSQP